MYSSVWRIHCYALPSSQILRPPFRFFQILFRWHPQLAYTTISEYNLNPELSLHPFVWFIIVQFSWFGQALSVLQLTLTMNIIKPNEYYAVKFPFVSCWLPESKLWYFNSEEILFFLIICLGKWNSIASNKLGWSQIKHICRDLNSKAAGQVMHI